MKPTRRLRRRGTLILCVLACLLLVTMMSVAWMKVARLERGHFRARPARLQADYLLNSGLSRAKAQLAANETYQGETWLLPAEVLPSGQATDVVIRVEPGSAPEKRMLTVTVQSPAGAPPRVRRETKLEIKLAKQELSP